ncbi:MAG: hypothetical protein CVV24_03485 [Ignavibacteriae bacterium HGW-Ignavibacteriae-3]|nr:MAG: hypothetical protein CVV24_03485 [Ignavibacteriae bacterium HGW-Ignavibacteriae-3]
MKEMLGNQYFMARNYPAAQGEFEECLVKNPKNKSVRKKLIVCYTQTGRIKEAIKFFNELIAEDIQFIINTNPVTDDCPCPELVAKIEGQGIFNEESLDYCIVLGIIWLYCDISKSLEYFIKANEKAPDDETLAFTLNTLERYIDSHPINKHIV